MQPDFGSGSGARAALQSPFTRTAFLEEESKADRHRRKEAARLLETRPLDPWERYRALSDHVGHLLDVTELADRKTRFALLILGALNAVNLLIAVRAPQLGADGLNAVFVQFYVTGYVVLSLYFFVFAIIALKPRPQEMGATSGGRDVPGLRLIGGFLDRDAEAHYETWRHAEMSQVNREMAMQSHMLARTNAEKFLALRRVYQGLFVLVALTAVFTIVIGIHAAAPSLLGL